MKKTILFSLALLSMASLLVAADADDVLGTWLTAESDDGRAKVEFVKKGNRYNGTIIWLEQPNYPPDDDEGMAGQPKVDRENPKSEHRKRPIIGLVLAGGFEYTEDNLWENGTIYDPNNGKTYKCKMWFLDADTLKVRGFIGFSLLGRTEIWTRAKD